MKNIADKILGFVLGLCLGVPVLVFAQQAVLDLNGQPALIALDGKDLYVGTEDTDNLKFILDNTAKWEMQGADGDLMPVTDGNVDIGSAAAEVDVIFAEDITLSGNLTSTDTGDIGWTLGSAANQACNTTCTAACVIGFDAGTTAFVACATATADTCICAG